MTNDSRPITRDEANLNIRDAQHAYHDNPTQETYDQLIEAQLVWAEVAQQDWQDS